MSLRALSEQIFDAKESLFDVPRISLYKYNIYTTYNVEGVGGALGWKWGHICVLNRTILRGSYF